MTAKVEQKTYEDAVSWLREHGFDTGSSCCHIVPLLVGDARAAVDLSRRLARRGLLVPAIRPPSVPEGTSRLRISLCAAHTEEDVARLVQALRDDRAGKSLA